MTTYLAEGDRVETFSSNSLIRHNTYLNEIQDQLRAMLGPLYMSGAVASASYDVSSGNHWYYIGTPYLWESTGHAEPLIMPFGPLRTGQKIDNLTVHILGTGAGGTIKFRNQSINPAPAIIDIGNAGADPWDNAGAMTEKTISGTPYIITSHKYFFIEFTPNSGASSKIAGFSFTAQFGN